MLALPLLVAALVVAPPTPADPATGADVIRMMQAKYEGTWYRTLTFVQATKHADGSVETWYEALRVPGALRFDKTAAGGPKVDVEFDAALVKEVSAP